MTGRQRPAIASVPVDVAHIIGAFVAGGAERFVTALASAQARSGLKVLVCALSCREDKTTAGAKSRLRDADVEISDGPTIKVGLRSIVSLRARITHYRPRIIHLHTPNTVLALALTSLWLSRKQIVIRTYHSTKIERSLAHTIANLWLGNKIDVACGEKVARSLANSGRTALVITNGVDFNWEIVSLQRRAISRRKLGIQLNRKIYVSIGRMAGTAIESAPKAHDVLVRAWKKTRHAKAEATLHLIGGGELEGALRHLANGEQTIAFEGVVDNPEEWLLAADVFVMASRFEGLPVAAIEALGTGVRCIFSRIGPLEELGAFNCDWVNADDENDLAFALDNATFGADVADVSDVSKFRAKFGIEQTCFKYYRLYASLCAEINSRSF